MRIAINALGYEADNGILNVLQTLALQKKEDEFIVFSDRPLLFISDLKVEIAGSPVNSLLGKRWWLDVKLPAALKKFRADILVNITGDASLRTRLPQLLYVGNTLFLDTPKQFSSAELLFLKFYLPKYLRKINALVVRSYYAKQVFEDQFDTAAEKISVIQTIVSEAYHELGWDEKEGVKEENADGRDYFLFSVNEQDINLVTVLKAFSQFKKWQRSNMKMIVWGDALEDETTEKINTYKFRDDVIVINDLPVEQKAELMAAAYAFIYMPLYDREQSVMIAAMRSGTPLIASDIAAMKEVAGEAVLYADPMNEELIAAQMIKLHKDEVLRSALIDEGRMQAARYPDNTSAERLWRLIERVAWGSAE